jgi:hypothetical protein
MSVFMLSVWKLWKRCLSKVLQRFWLSSPMLILPKCFWQDRAQIESNYWNNSLFIQTKLFCTRFFNQLFASAEKSPGGPLEALCIATVSRLSNVERKELSEWLRHLLLGQLCLDSPEVPSEEASESLEVATTNNKKTTGPEQAENQQLLRYLTSYIVKEGPSSEALSRTILEALIPIGSRLLSLDMPGTGFSDVMQIMVALANSGSRRGHIHLFCAATLWLEQCKEFILDGDTLKQIEKVKVIFYFVHDFIIFS